MSRAETPGCVRASQTGRGRREKDKWICRKNPFVLASSATSPKQGRSTCGLEGGVDWKMLLGREDVSRRDAEKNFRKRRDLMLAVQVTAPRERQHVATGVNPWE